MKRVIFPTYRTALAFRDPVLRRHLIDAPVSLVKITGVWTEVVTPSLYQLQDAGAGNFFIGGQQYLLSDADAIASGLPAQYLEPA